MRYWYVWKPQGIQINYDLMIIVIWSELTTIYCSRGSFYKQVFKQKIRSDNVFREKNANQDI